MKSACYVTRFLLSHKYAPGWESINIEESYGPPLSYVNEHNALVINKKGRNNTLPAKLYLIINNLINLQVNYIEGPYR